MTSSPARKSKAPPTDAWRSTDFACCTRIIRELQIRLPETSHYPSRCHAQCLNDNPDLHQQVCLLQIATHSRDAVEAYQEIRGKLEAMTGRINGAFATMDWVPIRYVNSAHRRDELREFTEARPSAWSRHCETA